MPTPNSSKDSRASLDVPIALAPGRSLSAAHCRQCNTINAADRKYCAGCGTHLWEPCLSCGTVNGVWEKFCGVCGSNMAALLKEKLDEADAFQRHIATLRQLFRHQEAIDLLEQSPVCDHPRLAAYKDQFARLAHELKTELDRLELERAEHFDAARQALSEHEYEKAIEHVEKIHRRLRTAPIQSLLEEARGAKDEAAALLKDIGESLSSKRTDGLLEKVERFLELQPHHAQAKELAARLSQMEQRDHQRRRVQLCKEAQALLQQHAYDEALRLLKQIPAGALTPEAGKLLEFAQGRCEEVNWLLSDLREPVVMDELLLPFADRLLKLKPEDAQVQAFVRRLQQRIAQWQAGGKRTRGIISQQPSFLGFPVNLLEGFRRIEVAPNSNGAAQGDFASDLYAACGLALQGLDRAALSVNLLPGQKKGLLGLLTGSMMKRRGKSAWGIDVGTCALKAVKLTYNSAADQVRMEASERIEYPTPLYLPEAERERSIREALQALQSRHRLTDDVVCVGYPAARTISRFIRLPPVKRDKVAEIMKFEASQQIPFPLETVTWNYQVTSQEQEPADVPVPREVGLFAVRSAEAQQFLFPFQELGISVDLLQSDAAALHNFLRVDCQANPSLPATASENLALLDIGAESSTMLVSSLQSVWFRSLPIGGSHFNKPLVTQLKLTQSHAEQLKRNPARAPWIHQAYAAMDPVFLDLIGELRRSFGYYENSFRGKPIGHLLICGGGSRLHGLLRKLRQSPD